MVEAGKTTDELKPLDYPDMFLKLLGYLPSKDFVKRYETLKHQKGIMARWHNYKYVSVANLTDRVFKSHFGFYADEWVSITLNNYVE